MCGRAYIDIMGDEDTSIRIKVDTWQRLNERKDRPNKSFDDVINELLEIAAEYEEGDEGNLQTATAVAD